MRISKDEGTLIHVISMILIVIAAAFLLKIFMNKIMFDVKEGFVLEQSVEDKMEESKKSQNNFLNGSFSADMLKHVLEPARRLRSILTNPDLWKERFELMKLSPTDLARKQLEIGTGIGTRSGSESTITNNHYRT